MRNLLSANRPQRPRFAGQQAASCCLRDVTWRDEGASCRLRAISRCSLCRIERFLQRLDGESGQRQVALSQMQGMKRSAGDDQSLAPACYQSDNCGSKIDWPLLNVSICPKLCAAVCSTRDSRQPGQVSPPGDQQHLVPSAGICTLDPNCHWPGLRLSDADVGVGVCVGVGVGVGVDT